MPHTNVRFRFVLLFSISIGLCAGWMLGGCGSVTSSELVTDDAGGAGGASSDAGDGSGGEAGPSAGGRGGASGAGGAASDAGDVGGAAGTGSSSNAGAGGSSAGGMGASAGAGGGISTAPTCAGEFRGSNPDCSQLSGWHCATNCANDRGETPTACVFPAASIYCVATCRDCRP